MATDDVIEVSMNSEIQGTPVVTKFHIALMDNTSDEADLISHINGTAGPQFGYMYNSSADLVMQEIVTRKVYPSKSGFTSWGVFQSIGSDGNTHYIQQIALLVSLYTGNPGRSARGRMYLPAMISDNGLTNKSKWNSAGINRWMAAPYGFFYLLWHDYGLGGSLAAHYRLCVFSRVRDGFNLVSSFAAHDEISTVRRRSLLQMHRTR